MKGAVAKTAPFCYAIENFEERQLEKAGKTMKQWMMVRKGADFAKIAEKFAIHPVLARLIRNRDVIGEEEIQEYLNGSLADLPEPKLMKDMEKAADIIAEKIKEQKKIRILGDYDIDGVMATYILLKGIQRCGGNADTKIPHRIADGYGLNENLVLEAMDDKVDTLLTCDNGISAEKEIALAKEKGMTVVVTDHHEVPFEKNGEEICYHIPAADAVVDPKQEDCSYPFEGICGAVVAWKLVEVLYEKSGIAREEAMELISFAAIATIGDVMDLKKENRILVREGLKRIKKTGNAGLNALLKCTDLWDKEISAYHIGFVIGPCINASGRLETAKKALELFLCRDENRAMELAGEMVALNDERKELTKEALEMAVKQIETEKLYEKNVLVVYLEHCHESLAGIVAGRIKEKYYKPTLVLTRGQEGLKGSGRSIEDYHMYEELNKCKELFSKFGGHKMAAGFSLAGEDYKELERRLNENQTLTEKELTPKLRIDMELPLAYINLKMIEELKRLEPYGNGNTRPVFALRNVKVKKMLALGKEKKFRKLMIEDENGDRVEGLLFQEVEQFETEIAEKYGKEALEAAFYGKENPIRFHIGFYPEINEYRNTATVQIKITDFLIC